MADNQNPYESPQAEVSAVTPLTSQGVLTETMLQHLKAASPWLRFVGITGFIMCGLAALMLLVMLIGVQNLPIPGWGGVLGAGIAVFYLGYLALLFFPVLFIFRFGGKIKSFVHTGSETDLEQAFKNNRSLWKFIGILCIISLSFMAIMVVFGGLAAVFASVFSA